MRVMPRVPTSYEAFQLTTSNLESVAAWCNGKICGVKLPPPQRCIKFWDKRCDDEVDVNIGDWILRDDNGYFNRIYESDFRSLFKEIS